MINVLLHVLYYSFMMRICKQGQFRAARIHPIYTYIQPLHELPSVFRVKR